MIKVNDKQIEFRDGMTVADALKTAGKSVDNMTLVMVDGKVFSPDQFKSEKLLNGSHIRVLILISGG